MPHPAGSQLLEVPIPDGIGVEDPGHPLPPRLVGTFDQMATLGDRIRRAMGPAPVVGDELLDRLLVGFQEHAATVAGSIDRLIAQLATPDEATTTLEATNLGRVVEQRLVAAAGLGRPSSPAERGDGPCPVPGCTETGGHSHPGWEVARANGRLDGALAQRWSPGGWSNFLRWHGIFQPEAMQVLRDWAEVRGEEPPASLRSIEGRPEMAQVLLDLADAHLAAELNKSEPFG